MTRQNVAPVARGVLGIAAVDAFMAVLWGLPYGKDAGTAAVLLVMGLLLVPQLAPWRRIFDALCLVVGAVLLVLCVVGLFFALFLHFPLAGLVFIARAIDRRSAAGKGSEVLTFVGVATGVATGMAWLLAILSSSP